MKIEVVKTKFGITNHFETVDVGDILLPDYQYDKEDLMPTNLEEYEYFCSYDDKYMDNDVILYYNYEEGIVLINYLEETYYVMTYELKEMKVIENFVIIVGHETLHHFNLKNHKLYLTWI